MLKRDELTNPESCMSRARDDEMTFVLLGRDAAAPVAIRAWITERIRLLKNRLSDPQIVEAEACANAIHRLSSVSDQYSHRLTVDIEGGVLVIRLGIDRLAHSATNHAEFQDENGLPRVVVTDSDVFARDVARALLHEEEDGTTPVDVMFDHAIEYAIGDGAEGINLDNR